MKKIILMTTVLATAFVAFNAFAEEPSASATEAGTATAKIVAPLAIDETKGLNFGTIMATSEPNTVTITTEGARSATNGTALVNDTSNQYQAGEFAVTGDASRTVKVTTDANTTVNGSGTAAGESMSVFSITTDATDGNLTLDTEGKGTIKTGAKLDVVADQTAGSYSGSYNVKVTY